MILNRLYKSLTLFYAWLTEALKYFVKRRDGHFDCSLMDILYSCGFKNEAWIFFYIKNVVCSGT